MKILLLGKTHFKKSLEELGHNVTAETGDCAEKMDVSGFDGDLIILHESLGMRELPHGIERASIPTVFYTIDVHLNFYWHREYAQLFDYVFVSQKDYVSRFQHENVFWLPWSVDPLIFRDYNLERKYDIVFVGTIDEQRKKRKNIISELEKRFEVKVFGTDPGKRLSFIEMAKVYSQAKIILNESIFGEITFRTFEAPACGGMLFTERIGNGLLDLFMDEKEIVTFDHLDFIEKAEYYLENSGIRQQIAKRGKEKVLKKHTVRKSIVEMISVLEQNSFRKRVASRERILISYGKALYFTGTKFPKHRRRRLYRARIALTKSLSSLMFDGEPALYLALIYFSLKKFKKAKEVLLPTINAGVADTLTDSFNDNCHPCSNFKAGKSSGTEFEKKEGKFLASIVFGFITLESDGNEYARKYFKNISCELDLDDNNFFINLGNAYLKKGIIFNAGAANIDKIPLTAIDSFAEAFSLEGLISSGKIFYQLGHYSLACSCFENAKMFLPDDMSLKVLLGLSNMYTYRIAVAIDQLKEALSLEEADKLNGVSADLKRIIKAEIFVKMKNYKAAINELLPVNCDEALIRMGRIYLEMNDPEKALLCFEKACGKRRYDPVARALLGTTHEKLGLCQQGVSANKGNSL